MMKLDIQMFAVPFRKVSKTRKRMRRSHNAMEIPGMTKCPKCGEMIKPHRVCPKCGKSTRVEYKIEDDKKVRICKKCGAKIK